MAGFREFVTGEVLTASNVDDFLAKQAVMKFADAAARDSALGTAVVSPNALREGMVAWLDDTNSVIAYDGSAWNPVGAEPPAGIGSNVVQTVKTDTFTTSSASYVAVTGFDVTITPTSASSKVLLIAQISGGPSANNSAALQVRFTGGNAAAYVGDAASNRIRAALMLGQRLTSTDMEFQNFTGTAMFLDSPNTTSAVTYGVEIQRGGAGSVFINRSGSDTDNTGFARTLSTMTAIEVSA